MKRKIAILGGGNGAHAAAVDLTLRGFDITMYEDSKFINNIKEVYSTRVIKSQGVCGEETVKIDAVTDNLEEAIKDAEVILVIVPAYVHANLSKKLAPIVRSGQIVVLLPGTFGSLVFYKEFLKQGVSNVAVAETHTLPYATRLIAPGEIMIMSRFNPLKLGVLPSSETNRVIEILSELYDGLVAVESVIACGLSSLNPIIHVPGCILNAGRIELMKGNFYFYTEGFTDVVVRATESIDRERISLLELFGYQAQIAARGVGGSIKSDSIKEVIASDKNFSQIKGPEDFKSRYYTEDIPYGLATWAKLAHAYGIATPTMDSMVNLGSVILEYDCWDRGHSLDDLGLAGMSLEKVKEYL